MFPSLINAKLSTHQETVCHATKGTTWSWEDVSLHQLRKSLTSDVENGIGTRKFVLNVPTDLFSMLPDNVFPSMTTVKNGTAVETVLIATKDTFSEEEFVLKETLSVMNLMLMELVLHATPDTSLTMEAVFQFQNLPHLPSTILNVVPRNSLNCQETWVDQLEAMLNSTHDVFADLYLNNHNYHNKKNTKIKTLKTFINIIK